MQLYKTNRGNGFYYIFSYLALVDMALVFIILYLNSYVLLSILKITFVVVNLHFIYYCVQCITLKYAIDDKAVYIRRFGSIKTITIPLKDIEGYKIEEGRINGTRLSGFAKNTFAFGRNVISKIGTTRMFVTSSKHIIYLKQSEINYGISPEKYEEFEKQLISRNIEKVEWEHHYNKVSGLYKDKRFKIPFLIVSVIVLFITFFPFILYLTNNLPSPNMPLNFDARFNVVQSGSGKQFAINQMIYGVLNMIVLFCMYYASYFHAKYDKKSANRYLYASLIIAIIFLVLQIRTLYYFR